MSFDFSLRISASNFGTTVLYQIGVTGDKQTPGNRLLCRVIGGWETAVVPAK
jgi:hypothetical protein